MRNQKKIYFLKVLSYFDIPFEKKQKLGFSIKKLEKETGFVDRYPQISPSLFFVFFSLALHK